MLPMATLQFVMSQSECQILKLYLNWLKLAISADKKNDDIIRAPMSDFMLLA